jgi:hypothetical protein
LVPTDTTLLYLFKCNPHDPWYPALLATSGVDLTASLVTVLEAIQTACTAVSVAILSTPILREFVNCSLQHASRRLTSKYVHSSSHNQASCDSALFRWESAFNQQGVARLTRPHTRLPETYYSDSGCTAENHVNTALACLFLKTDVDVDAVSLLASCYKTVNI